MELKQEFATETVKNKITSFTLYWLLWLIIILQGRFAVCEGIAVTHWVLRIEWMFSYSKLKPSGFLLVKTFLFP